MGQVRRLSLKAAARSCRGQSAALGSPKLWLQFNQRKSRTWQMIDWEALCFSLFFFFWYKVTLFISSYSIDH